MKKLSYALMAAVLCAMTFGAVTTTSADMLLMPPRVVFKDSDRMKTLTVVNTSTKSATYRLTFMHQKQREQGGYDKLDGPLNPEFDLAKMLVFSPRQVNLDPAGKQGVRLSLRRPENLPDGEYRVHVKVGRYETDDDRKISAKGQTVGLGFNIGFAVPVILRKGKYDTTAKIVETKYLPRTNSAQGVEPPKLQIKIKREGKYSATGALKVFWRPSANAEEEQVGIQNMVNVFPEINNRVVAVQLKKDITGGVFHVRFEGEDLDKDVLFDDMTAPGP